MKTFKELQERLAEAKVEAGRSDYGKASVRNKRRFGKEGEPAVFDASGERGKMIDKRRAEHKAKRGVKEGYKGTADLSKADPAAKKKVEDRIAKHFGTKRVPGGKMGVKEEEMNPFVQSSLEALSSIVKKKSNLGEEGYDVARDMGRVRPSKDKKDATSYPVSKEVRNMKGDTPMQKEFKKKYGEKATALDAVKQKYKGQIMGKK